MYRVTSRNEPDDDGALKGSNKCPFGPDYQNYWNILSPRDKTYEMDIEGLYSMTVEPLAAAIADRIVGDKILDAFCGIGGNAIAFALAGKDVISFDLNLPRLEMAKRNAEKMGVSHMITFHHGDILEHIEKVTADAIFLDPPWGGPEYTNKVLFPLDGFTPSGRVLLESAMPRFQCVSFKLPDNFDFSELNTFGNFTIHEDRLDGRLLHYTAQNFTTTVL